MGSLDAVAEQQMQEAIAENLPEIRLDPIMDLLLPVIADAG